MNQKLGERAKKGGGTHKQLPERRPEKPIARAILQFLGRALWLVAWCLKKFGVAIRQIPSWLYRKKGTIARLLGIGFWRATTLLSVGYLVYDRLYETEATIISPASDPNDIFRFPFSIRNNSHIFTIKNVRWYCAYINIDSENGPKFQYDLVTPHGIVAEIPPGETANVPCNWGWGPIKARRSTIAVGLLYDTDIFGFFDWPRVPPTTPFTWYGDASDPQWIRGEFAR